MPYPTVFQLFIGIVEPNSSIHDRHKVKGAFMPLYEGQQNEMGDIMGDPKSSKLASSQGRVINNQKTRKTSKHRQERNNIKACAPSILWTVNIILCSTIHPSGCPVPILKLFLKVLSFDEVTTTSYIEYSTALECMAKP